MNQLHIKDDIIPIGEFKTHAARILRQLRDTGRPIVITQNGKAAGVLVSAADFDRMMDQQRFVTAVNDGLADADAGRTISDEELTVRIARS